MSLSIGIRKIRPEDNEAVRQLYLTSNELMNVNSSFTKVILDTDLKDPYSFYSKEKREMYIFTDSNENDKIVGMAGLIPTQSNDRMEVVRLSVSHQHRRKGVGTVIIKFLQSENKLTLSCIRSNRTAIAFYNKFMTHTCSKEFESRTGEKYVMEYYTSD